jgi:hypothetical protein
MRSVGGLIDDHEERDRHGAATPYFDLGGKDRLWHDGAGFCALWYRAQQLN